MLLPAHLDSEGAELGAGLETLVSDHLEILAGATLIHVEAPPDAGVLRQLPPDLVVLRMRGHREGDQLSLISSWTTAARLAHGTPWTHQEFHAQEPEEALAAWVSQWPFPKRSQDLSNLLPGTSAAFWRLLQAMSIRSDQAASAHLQASQDLVKEDPDCATAWATLGDHLYRSLWVNPEQAGVGLNSRTHRAFQEAVKLVPGHPRATFLWSLMLTDTGNQHEALRILGSAVRLRPGSPDLYHGLAYSGRTSGLLKGSQAALEYRRELLGPMDSPSVWFTETSHLYLGDLGAFAKELEQLHVGRNDASIAFYQGYLALLRGQREPATAFMRAGLAHTEGPRPFQDLCQAYLAHLEGRAEEGVAGLRKVDEIRGKLHIPDGEWTFKEAEAYSLLGDADRAVDCATRAFVQGFSCARWYEQSPFLERMRRHPRWPMLRRNVRERQAVLEGSYPPASFLP
jgi:tetratricopeptide (TPR) repeat protein